jgi:hypothetical protein
MTSLKSNFNTVFDNKVSETVTAKLNLYGGCIRNYDPQYQTNDYQHRIVQASAQNPDPVTKIQAQTCQSLK